ncbi:uncharacterized protein V6R79_012426 [Siganus canaliculatus]
MKAQFFVPLTVTVSVVLFGVMRIRKRDLVNGDKEEMYTGIKLRVVFDVLADYNKDVEETQKNLDSVNSRLKSLEGEVAARKQDQMKSALEACQGEQKSLTDAAAAGETEFNGLKATSDKETASWKSEVETLKQQLAKPSPVCSYLKKDSESSKLCPEAAPAKKEEPPKAEAPKPEEPKAEAPKAEEPKAEAPKAEQPKADAPKPEQPKAEAPKPEEPKAEAPKAEAPKPEEPKADAPKAEEPKADAPKAEEPKADAPKAEEPKADAPKAEEPKEDAPKAEAPK